MANIYKYRELVYKTRDEAYEIAHAIERMLREVLEIDTKVYVSSLEGGVETIEILFHRKKKNKNSINIERCLEEVLNRVYDIRIDYSTIDIGFDANAGALVSKTECKLIEENITKYLGRPHHEK